MSKHRERVQFRRKIAARNSEATGYGSALIDIYRRATQGGSADYLTTNQPSEPERIARILAQAEERRKRRNAKRIRQHAQTSANGQPNRQQQGGSVRAERIAGK